MASIVRYLRVGEESAYATEAATYSETLDPSSAALDPATEDKLVWEGIGGLDRRAGLGVYTTEGDITLPLDDTATGWFWKWALGGYSVSGTTPSFTHMFTPQQGATMPSFSAAIGKDITEHIFLGNVVSSIELAAESEWAELTVSTVGAKDKKGPLQEQVTYTDGQLFTAPNGTLVRGGSPGTDLSVDVNSVTLTIETGANVEDNAGFGSRFPSKASRGGLMASLEIQLAFTSTDQLVAFWGGSDGPSTDTITEDQFTLSFGPNLDIAFPRLIFTGAEQPAEGREAITQTLTGRGLYDDGSGDGPVSVSLTNDRETY